VLRVRKPSSVRPKSKPKVIWDPNMDFPINPDWDPGVCRIAAKMLWIKYLVGDSHFAKCRENRPVTMRNASKSPKIPCSAMAREVESVIQKLISASDL